MSFGKLVNTRYFSEAALDWKKNKGIYTRAPIGSREYQEYWDMHEERCMNGYKVADLWIPGRHYFYLNFTPILKIPDQQLLKMLRESKDKRGNLGAVTMEKILEFPRFFEIDYEWYRFKHIAWNGGRFRGITSLGGKNIACAKTRGCGFSYKESSDGVYNYTFIPDSKSYYFASLEQYLIVDGIMNKVQGMADWINVNIPQWKQNRMEHNTLMHMKASYIDEFGAKKGNMSEAIGVVVDNPNKTRGKRGKKIVFEEAGSFKRLKEALAISVGAMKDGSFKVGQISVFGTGGEEGPSIEGLEDIWSEPHVYDMLAFRNVWEEGMEGTECGYFVPATKANIKFMDEDGNVDLDGALNFEQGQRDIKAKAKDVKELDRYKAEYPIYPSEVFQRLAKNPFRTAEIDKQIQRIERNAAIQALIRHGQLTRGDKGVEFTIQTREQARPIEDYPHNQRDSLEGCVSVVERPYLNQRGKTPEGLYQIVFDPYYKEESEDLTSLFAVYVLKQYNNIDTVNEGLPVAWFVARPQDLNRAYEVLFMLSDWYNCTIQGEIAGGGQGVLDYAKRHKLLHKLEYEIEMTETREVTAKKVRSYLMNMPTEKKRMGLTYLINWHMEQRGIDENGNPIYNIHRFYDVGALREMRKFDGKRNADRISALIVGMFMLREKVNQVIKQAEEKDDFYSRELFGNEQQTSETIERY
jgi:hypothetical protein